MVSSPDAGKATSIRRHLPIMARYLLPWLCLITAGLLSVRAGKDYSWDLRNYHYYNAWAFLNDRLDVDVLPANIQGYINPLIELPFYLLIKLQLSDYLVGFALGAPAGLAMWLVWLITGRLCPAPHGAQTKARIALRALTTAAAVSGAAGSIQWGTTSGEWPVTCIVILALYLSLPLPPGTSTKARFAIGPLLGLAVGLKLTAVPFATAVGLTYAWQELRYRTPGRNLRLTALIAGGLTVLVLTLAPWGWQLWQRFHNPLFPYFNGVFKSDMVEKSNWRDDRFLPANTLELLRLPWDLAFRREARYGDSVVRDRRILMGCIAAVACIAGSLASPERRARLRANNALSCNLVFGLALVGWVLTTAIYRYAIGIEIMACLCVFVATTSLIDAKNAREWGQLLVFLPVIGTSAASLGRSTFNGGAYFQETFPSIPAGSLVINYVPEDPPLAYLSPMFGTQVTVVKPMSNLSRGHLNLWFQRRIEQVIASSKGPVFLIATPPYTAGMLRYLAGQQLEPAKDRPCGSIRSQSFELHDYVCELRRTGR